MGSITEQPFMLYYGAHSICSIMVRMTYALRGPPKSGLADMQLVLQEVDIGNGNEQFTEHFLCDINKEGYVSKSALVLLSDSSIVKSAYKSCGFMKVPVLTNESALPGPLPESEAITYFFCDRYPQLLPQEHESLIKRLITDLHKISFYSLTFGLMPARGLAIQDHINKILKDPTISQRYREALLYKKAQ